MKYIVLLLLITITGLAVEVTKITSVHDGDTLACVTNRGDSLTVRLYGIDAPELDQGFNGVNSKDALERITDAFTHFELIVVNKDRYDRTVGILIGVSRVYPCIDINAYMLMTGNAWYYLDTKPVSNNYKFLENYAKQSKRGMWLFDKNDNTPPWEWRKQNKSHKE